MRPLQGKSCTLIAVFAALGLVTVGEVLGDDLECADLPKTTTPNTLYYQACDEDAGAAKPTCGDGSDYGFIYKTGKRGSRKLIIEYQGGGACWKQSMCKSACASGVCALPKFDGFTLPNLNGITYETLKKVNFLPIVEKHLGGIPLGLDDRFFPAPAENVLDWNYIFVPYCTQDIHMGYAESSRNYSGVEVMHRGGVNTRAVYNWIKATFQGKDAPDTIILTGCSAGGTAAQVIYAGVLRELFPKAHIVSFGDAPAVLLTDSFVQNDLPKWHPSKFFDMVPGLSGLALSSFDGNLFVRTMDIFLQTYKDVVFAYFSAENDVSSRYFYSEMGGDSSRFKSIFRDTMDKFKTSSSGNFESWLVPGEAHCTFSLQNHFRKEGSLTVESANTWVTMLLGKAGVTFPSASPSPASGMTASEEKNPGDMPPWIWYLIGGVCLLVIAAIVGTVVCVRRRRKNCNKDVAVEFAVAVAHSAPGKSPV